MYYAAPWRGTKQNCTMDVNLQARWQNSCSQLKHIEQQRKTYFLLDFEKILSNLHFYAGFTFLSLCALNQQWASFGFQGEAISAESTQVTVTMELRIFC